MVHRKKAIVSSLLLALVIASLGIFAGKGDKSSDIPASLGAQTEQTQEDDRRTDEKPDFSVLYPQGKAGLTAVTRKAPSGDLIHTFRDSLEDTEIEVTQQKVPDSFKGNEQTELEKLAKNFLAENVIQIDQNTIYHGKDEKTDVQSLFFIKSESLVSIRSAKPLSDDTWAAYILSLN